MCFSVLQKTNQSLSHYLKGKVYPKLLVNRFYLHSYQPLTTSKPFTSYQGIFPSKCTNNPHSQFAFKLQGEGLGHSDYSNFHSEIKRCSHNQSWAVEEPSWCSRLSREPQQSPGLMGRWLWAEIPHPQHQQLCHTSVGFPVMPPWSQLQPAAGSELPPHTMPFVSLSGSHLVARDHRRSCLA